MAMSTQACRTKKEAATASLPGVATIGQPAWVSEKPVSNLDYIGIGSCPKSRQDYLETAKKNALNDLASEISVTVESNSLLYTLDRKYKFEEEYTSNITTRTKEQIEGYELAGSYDGNGTYWTYYRLNKEQYARIKAERKQQAIDLASDLYRRAQASLAAGDLKTAFDLDLRGLVAMKDFWGANDQVMLEGKNVPLANELFNNLQVMASGTRLAILPERCLLDWSNRFARQMMASASYATTGKALAQLPLLLEWPGADGKVSEFRSTDAEGRARITVQHIAPGATALEMRVGLDADALVAKDLEPAFTKPLIASLTLPEMRVPIDRIMPKFYLLAAETNLGTPVEAQPLALAMKEVLSANGFREVARQADADLLIDLTAGTREMGESNGFFTAAMDVTLKVRDRRSNEVVYTGGKQSVKGIQLNYSKAGLDAYKKGAADLRNELAPALVNAILQQ